MPPGRLVFAAHRLLLHRSGALLGLYWSIEAGWFWIVQGADGLRGLVYAHAMGVMTDQPAPGPMVFTAAERCIREWSSGGQTP